MCRVGEPGASQPKLGCSHCTIRGWHTGERTPCTNGIQESSGIGGSLKLERVVQSSWDSGLGHQEEWMA